VVANHALVLVQAAMADDDSEGLLPTRYIFDEGHHLFDAADGAFSAHITGMEGAELRRWILGAEGRRTRARGLERRVGDLIDDEGLEHLDAALKAARCLPAEGWRQRLVDGSPLTPAERFLAHVRRQVLARVGEDDRGYNLECHVSPAVDGLIDAARALDAALQDLVEPLLGLAQKLKQQLDDDADTLETQTRVRMEAMIRGLKRRGLVTLAAWRSMLGQLEQETPEAFVDWFSLDRIDGRELDVGMHRHWRDPGLPFANHVAERSHGLVVTSATLRDRATDEDDDDWDSARLRTGLRHLIEQPQTAEVPSPFDYAAQTRVIVITDVRRNQSDQVAAAYRELFKAAGGGALGLFTAIARLRQVHKRIAADLDHAGLTLYAQHVDAMDTGTLVDIFRAETDACLLGTDAVRDGVDVPGRSLRLVVFDRVPWPRPDILHKARREAFGGNRYDDLITRLRLRQAFGRLVRRADDKGVFVMLDSALPTRLTTAFPAEVEVERIGLADAVSEIAEFLAEKT
jgi:ATP-dependent DNA helicase DinG